MGFRDDRLRDVLQAKGWGTANLHHATKIPYSRLGRYLKRRDDQNGGEPSLETFAAIVVALQVDADYLLDTTKQYDGEKPRRDVAHMALDRYLVDSRLGDNPVTEPEEVFLRRVADEHSSPPLWVADWRKEHESLRLRDKAEPPSTPEPARHHRIRRRLPPS